MGDRPAYEYDRRCDTGVSTDSGIQAGAEPPIHESDVGLQRAASPALFTNSPGGGVQSDVTSSDSSDVVVEEVNVQNSVVNAENCVDSFLSDGLSE